ncbi:MAG: histidine phosphatase family protein [Clostridia bacterium]|nr:histidine phosphatase family protein [Clostridia bacterium]
MSEVKPIIEMELYIVRHGQSCMNIKDGYGVPVEELTRDQRENPPLTELGKRQAELLGEYYKDVKFDAVYASPLRRATMTADYALQKNNVSDKHIYTMPWLIECGVGEDYSAVTFDELNAEFDGRILAPEGIDVSGYLICGDGQNQASHRRRAENVIAYLKDRYHDGEKVMCVAHGGFNTDIFLHAIGAQDTLLFDPAFDNTGVTKIIFYKEGTGSYGFDIELCYLNSTAHLARN